MDIELAELDSLLGILAVIVETERAVSEVVADMDFDGKGVRVRVAVVREELLARQEDGLEVI